MSISRSPQDDVRDRRESAPPPARNLLQGAALDAPLAWRDGRPISRRQYLADVAALAERLPARGTVLSLTATATASWSGFGAAMLRGQTSLLPPNHTPDMLRAAAAPLYPDVYCIVDPRHRRRSTCRRCRTSQQAAADPARATDGRR